MKGCDFLTDDDFLTVLYKILNVFLQDPYNSNLFSHDIQICILNKIIEIETIIRNNKQQIKNNKSLIQKSDTENKRLLSIKSKSLKDENIYYKEYIKKLREVTDSLVFTYFSKYDLKSLCWKQSPGFISGKAGLQKELEIFETYFKEGKFAILNDISNCLRFGDLTIMKDNKPFFIESKSSDFIDDRVIRQKENLKNTLNIINNDTINNFLGTNKKFKRVYSSNAEKNYIDILQNMIQEALNTGKSIKNLEEGLTYLIFHSPIDPKESTEKVIKEMKKPFCFYLNSYKHINENYTPFPLILKNSYALQEFNNGNLLIIIFIDLDIMNIKLNKLGYKLITKDTQNKEFKISFSFNDDIIEMNISNYNFFRIGREFLSLDWFISVIDDVIKYARANA